MKKLLKRISTIILAISILLSNSLVKAYDQSITISKNIVIDANNSDYVSLINELKNDNSVVYQQNVAITYEQFNELTTKKNSNNKYLEEQYAIIQKKAAELGKLQAELEVLQAAAEKAGATDAEKAAFETAKINFQAKAKEATEFSTNVEKQVLNNKNAFEQMVPGFDNTKWTKLSLSEKTANENKYKFIDTEDSYFVIWIKVTLNGQDYYKYDIYCEKEIDNPRYCEIVDGKYYNKQGKEVTKAEYEADCLEKKYFEISNGKYYNKQGKEVTKAEYEADCLEKKICKIENGKYYDNNGKEVTKAEYDKACTTPDNPKTGLNNNILYGVLITLVAASSYVVVRKARKFSR